MPSQLYSSYNSEDEDKQIYYNYLQDDDRNVNMSFDDINNDNKKEEDHNKQSTETEAESKKNAEKTENIEENPTNNTGIKTKEKEIISNNVQTSITNNFLTLNMIDLKIDDDDYKKKGKEILKRKRGRKVKGSNSGEHNKFSDDNLRRKVKHLVLKNVFDFINEKIRSMYSDINKGIFTKQLLTINQKQISDATILFNKKFLEKPLKDIFSVEISKRYTNYLESHNKNLINFLMNEEEDENKRVYFNNLFNLKFIECLEHFRGTADYIHLEGMKTFDEIKDDFAKDKNYLDVLTKYVEEYENITRNKKERTEFSYDY